MSERVAHELATRNQKLGGVVLVGIRTGGYVWAQRLVAILEKLQPNEIPRLGALDIALYRDDITTRLVPEVGPSELPRLDGQRVILVDDVLYTGRTVRAALDALLDYGRPTSVQLAVLVDRGLRELPIEANYVGMAMQTVASERVRVDLSGGDLDKIVVHAELLQVSRG